MKNLINFTVGPVQMSNDIREIGAEQVPYFRTSEFSELMLENEKLVKKFMFASDESRVVFITGSGTASMEASVINTLNSKDKVLIVNGGSFGKRFVDICNVYGISYDEIKLQTGESLKQEHLEMFEGKGYTAFVVNVHETSTGVHYDLELISKFCKEQGLFLIVDAISSFLADELDMQKLGIDVIITGSQKALACPPGVSIIVLSDRAVKKVYENKPKTLYLDLKSALNNAERGQTPFTPAVGTLIQINKRLKQIEEKGGVETEIERVKKLAEYFREKIKHLPFKIVTESPSNAVTSLYSLNDRANDIFITLKDEYGIWICPNGGELKNKIFRVGHIGYLTEKDYDKLVDAFDDMNKKGLL